MIDRAILENGQRFDFYGHGYLIEPYFDDTHHIVERKAAQVGCSTKAIFRTSWLTRYKLLMGAAYYFPTQTDVRDFSRARVSPILENNPDLQAMDTNNVGLKRIGSSYMYLRGMKTKIGTKSIPVDMVVFDEMDDMGPVDRLKAIERISHSQHKFILELSNPSITNYGIDAVFRKSDQRFYYLKCGACNEWTALQKEFPSKLGLEVKVLRRLSDGRVIRACKKCGAELDLNQEGQWRADFPGRDIHGYSYSQLFSAMIDAKTILDEYETTDFPEPFYNYKIGTTFDMAEGRITETEIYNLCGDAVMDEVSFTPCSMGVDVGNSLHYHISKPGEGSRRRSVKFGTVISFEELDNLMKNFKVFRCVIDAMPEKRKALEFAQRFPGRVFLCYYVENSKGTYQWDEEKMQVNADRTETLDASAQVIHRKEIIFPRRLSSLTDDFARQMASLARKLETNPRGEKRYVYVNVNQEGETVGKNSDHYRHAFNYDCMAWKDNSFKSMPKPAGFTNASRIISTFKIR